MQNSWAEYMDIIDHFWDLFLYVRVILKWISRNKSQCFEKSITQRNLWKKRGSIKYVYNKFLLFTHLTSVLLLHTAQNCCASINNKLGYV